MRGYNDACMKVIQSGRNPTMRHLHRVHGVSSRVLDEIVGKGRHSSFVDVFYTPTDDMKADILTKLFTISSSVAHDLNNISIIKQDIVLVTSKCTRLNTKTSVALPCIPVLMPKPPGDGDHIGNEATASGHAGNTGYVAERLPTYKPPPPPVLPTSRPRSNSRVICDACS